MLHRDVAIKVLEGDNVGDQAVDRFEREVQLIFMTTVQRPMERSAMPCITLYELVEDFGCQPPGRVIHLLHQICGWLSEAHQMRMVHRDVKPSSILVTPSVRVYDIIKVLDFGLVFGKIDR